MKIKNLKDIKAKDIKELEKIVSKLRIDLMKNKVKIAGNKEKNLKTGWKLKKEIAQLLTIIKQKGI